MGSANIPQDQYWASLDLYSQSYLEACCEKVAIYRRHCDSTGKTSKWQRSIQNYYGVSSDGMKSSNEVTRGGESGQIIMGKVSDYRNLIQHQLILITSQRPAGVAKAINSDTDSLHQARIGSLLTEYYLSQVGWEQRFVRGAEVMQVADESYLVLSWKPKAGEDIRPNPETGEMIKTGDSDLQVFAPWHMARDPYIGGPDAMEWGIYDWRENKWNLAAQYPNQWKDIIDGSSQKIPQIVFDPIEAEDTDQTTVYCVSHKPSPACPDGRLTLFVPDAILLDGPFPYPEHNVYRMSQGDVIDTGFGYTNNNDLLAIEEVTDALHSIIMTNQITTGMNAIIAAQGLGLTYQEIARGLPYFEVNPALFEKIKVLELTKTAPEIFNYLEVMGRKKETLAGINSVVRGDPEGALRSNSGSALALVQAQSLAFNSGGQRAYYQALSKVNTGHIMLLQRFANSEKVIRITGKVQGQYLQEFKYSGKDLDQISSVVFETVDPTFQTSGGKVAAAENLLSKGLIKNARQYLTVMRTGSLDAFTEDDEADEMNIKAEGEMLREGKPVQAVLTENHEEHIQGHQSIISSPQAKQDPQLVQAVLSHIQQHVDMWTQLSQTNPALLIATKQKILPPPPMPGMPVPPQGAPSGAPEANPSAPGPGGGGGNMPAQLGHNQPVETKAATVKPPQMPVNPATHERVPVPGMS